MRTFFGQQTVKASVSCTLFLLRAVARIRCGRHRFATCGALALMIPVGLLQSESTNAQDGFRRGNRRTIQAFSRVQRYNACNSRRAEPRNIGRCGVANCGIEGCDPRLAKAASCRSGNCRLFGCSTCQTSRRDFCDSPRFDGRRFGNPGNFLPPPRPEQRGQPGTRSHRNDSNMRRDDRPPQPDSRRHERPNPAPIVQGEIQWRTDLQAAHRESSDTGLPILIKFSANWCGPCKLMKTETFTDASLTEMINACFIPVEVDTDQNEQLARQLRIETVPTTMVISPDGDIVERREGFQSASQLSRAIARFCNHPGGHPVVSNEPRARFGR